MGNLSAVMVEDDGSDWRTNITSGGSIFLREPNDEPCRVGKESLKGVWYGYCRGWMMNDDGC